jgi:hypothetical protein
VSSFSHVLADLPKIIDPSLVSSMTTFVVSILMMSPFVVLLEVVDICPLPDLSTFVDEWSSNLVGPVLGNRIEGISIGLVLEVPTYQIKTDVWVAPKQGIVASRMDMVACPIFDLDIGRWYVHILIWHRWIWGWRRPCRHVRS